MQNRRVDTTDSTAGMPENWRSTTNREPSLKPPLQGADEPACPELPERCDPQWEVPHEPGRQFGFSTAKGDVRLEPPEY